MSKLNLLNLVLNSFCRFSVSLSYYGISFSIPDLSGDRYLNFMIGKNIFYIFDSLDKLKPKTKNHFFFVSNISTLLYTLKNFCSPSVFLSSVFKVFKKVVELSFTYSTKNILRFSI